ncbi:hypothetical protein L209DRAFT_227482 [Thermothelomyces heterothallicus CBS 203.75]
MPAGVPQSQEKYRGSGNEAPNSTRSAVKPGPSSEKKLCRPRAGKTASKLSLAWSRGREEISIGAEPPLLRVLIPAKRIQTVAEGSTFGAVPLLLKPQHAHVGKVLTAPLANKSFEPKIPQGNTENRRRNVDYEFHCCYFAVYHWSGVSHTSLSLLTCSPFP